MYDELENLSNNGAVITINLRNGLTHITIRHNGKTGSGRARGLVAAGNLAIRDLESGKEKVRSGRREKQRMQDQLLRDPDIDDPRYAW